MKRAIRLAIAAILLAPTGLMAACVRGGPSDSGVVVGKRYSASGLCELKLEGDRSGWIALARIEPDELEDTHLTDGSEVCSKVVVKDAAKKLEGDGYFRTETSITVTVQYTASVGKPAKGPLACVVRRTYEGGLHQATQYPRKLPRGASYPPECNSSKPTTAFDEQLTADIVTK